MVVLCCFVDARIYSEDDHVGCIVVMDVDTYLICIYCIITSDISNATADNTDASIIQSHAIKLMQKIMPRIY